MLANARFTLPRSGLVVLLAALAAFAPMSIDMYLPALPSIARDLGVPASEVQATLAVFMAGFSAGMPLFGFGALAMLVVVLLLPETHSKEARGGMTMAQALGAYWHILSDGPAFGLTVASAAVFAGLFAYISGSSFVFIEHFGIAPGFYAMLFAMNAAAIMGAAFLNSRLTRRFELKNLLSGGVLISFTAGLYLVVIEQAGLEGPVTIMAGLMVFVAMVPILGANGMALLMARYPKNAGAAAATLGAAQFGSGAVAALVVGALHDGTAFSMCAVMGASGLIALLAFFTLCRKL